MTIAMIGVGKFGGAPELRLSGGDKSVVFAFDNGSNAIAVAAKLKDWPHRISPAKRSRKWAR